jgi:hypothetical protein
MRTLLQTSVFLRFKQLLLALIVIGALYMFCPGAALPNQINPTPASVQSFGTNEKKAALVVTKAKWDWWSGAHSSEAQIYGSSRLKKMMVWVMRL